ncbi:unnamed protein product, partial [marine sediment metagenome]
SPAWEEVAEPCVDCAGCNHICPTCRCFLLFDKKGEKGFERTRLWDGCLYTGFARVAAGANPRSKLSQRFANRLLSVANTPCENDTKSLQIKFGREAIQNLNITVITGTAAYMKHPDGLF